MGGTQDEDNTREENDQIWDFLPFKSAHFGHILKKISTFIFWCMVIPLGPLSVYTYWEAQRLCKIDFLRNQTMEKGHLTWSMVWTGPKFYWALFWVPSENFRARLVRDPSVFKFNWLHVDIFQFFCLLIWLYSLNFS